MLEIKTDIPLSSLTTFRIGGKATYFCEVKTAAELGEAAAFVREKKLPYFILGEGSNTLASDAGFSGLVIRIALRGVKMKDAESVPGAEKVELVAGAGEKWDDVVALSVSKQLYGLENLSAIPGTVGAAPVQNIGAYGAEVKDTISSVETFNMKTGKLKTWTPDQCKFTYRDSVFKDAKSAHLVITKVSFLLEKAPTAGGAGRVNIGYKDLKERFKDVYSKEVSLEAVRQAVVEIRAAKLPDITKLGTAGSFFKNPIIRKELYEELCEEYPGMPCFAEGHGRVKVPLAWILDKVCNLKGKKDVGGRVGTYEKQPIALVNFGGGTAEEVTRLARDIAATVKEKTGIDVEWEVQKVG